VYIYLSNESETPVEVFFDDFRVEHIKSPVVQMEDYYPFGLTFNSYKRENSTENRYLYNQGTGEKTFKTERIIDLELNVDQSKYRTYDYLTGRWWQIDPKADQGGQEAWSSYHYSFNNPIRYSDPYGDCPPGVDCNNPLPNMQVRQNRASNLGPGYVRNNGTRAHRGHDLYSPTGTTVSSSMAGTVVSATNAGDNGYGNTVVVKTNIHPEAQPDFVGPPRPGGAPEDNVYVQYSHLESMNVSTGDVVTMGQNIGTVGTTGNASGMTGADVHLHIQVGTELNASGISVSNTSAVSPNLVYNNVSFESADPAANQTNTGVVKTVTNANGTQTRIHQQAGNTGATGNAILLDEVQVTDTRGN
jgi:RHS repeat-associated protein